jgi:hypothetical protein
MVRQEILGKTRAETERLRRENENESVSDSDDDNIEIVYQIINDQRPIIHPHVGFIFVCCIFFHYILYFIPPEYIITILILYIFV